VILWKLAPLAIGLSVLGVIFTTTGCGSGSTHARLMNAMSGISSIDMLLDNKSSVTGVTYGAASGYVTVNRGSHNLIVESTGSSPLINQTASFPSGDSTVLATDSGAVVLTDNNGAPSPGNIKMRVINASPTLGTADVYIVASGTSIAGLTPTFSNLAYQAASGYQSLAAGSYQVIFTLPGQQFAEITSSAQSFASGQIRTAVALDAQGGGFTTAVLSDLN
jgi:hypothetical protein